MNIDKYTFSEFMIIKINVKILKLICQEIINICKKKGNGKTVSKKRQVAGIKRKVKV